MENVGALETVVPNYLQEGSSRQVVRGELFKRAFANISSKAKGPRALRRALARDISKELYRRGERLTEPKPEMHVQDHNLVTLA